MIPPISGHSCGCSHVRVLSATVHGCFFERAPPMPGPAASGLLFVKMRRPDAQSARGAQRTAEQDSACKWEEAGMCQAA